MYSIFFLRCGLGEAQCYAEAVFISRQWTLSEQAQVASHLRVIINCSAPPPQLQDISRAANENTRLVHSLGNRPWTYALPCKELNDSGSGTQDSFEVPNFSGKWLRLHNIFSFFI